MRRWMVGGALLALGCAQPVIEAAPPQVIVDAGPSMTPLAPYRDKGDPPPPPCDPAWRERIRVRMPDTVMGYSVAGDRIVRLGWGTAAITDGDSWVRADGGSIPDIVLSRRRRVAFGDAHVVSADEVYVVGHRLTLLRWDGADWRLEHQDTSLSARGTHAARVMQCDGSLIAYAIGVMIRREENGTWRRVDDDERMSLRERCVPDLPRYPRPAEPCGNYDPYYRAVQCRAGLRVYSERMRRWLAPPDDVRVERYWLQLHEHDGGFFLVAEGSLLHTDGETWTREEVGGGPISRIFGDDRGVYAVAGNTIYTRDLCE